MADVYQKLYLFLIHLLLLLLECQLDSCVLPVRDSVVNQHTHDEDERRNNGDEPPCHVPWLRYFQCQNAFRAAPLAVTSGAGYADFITARRQCLVKREGRFGCFIWVGILRYVESVHLFPKDVPLLYRYIYVQCLAVSWQSALAFIVNFIFCREISCDGFPTFKYC